MSSRYSKSLFCRAHTAAKIRRAKPVHIAAKLNA